MSFNYDPSTNFTPGRGGQKLQILVFHKMDDFKPGVDFFNGTRQWFKNPSSQASSTFLVGGPVGNHDGEILQMVPYDATPWTHGINYWDDPRQKAIIRNNPGYDSIGNSKSNSMSWSVEFQPTENGVYTDAQYHAAALIAIEFEQYSGVRLSRENFFGHSDVDPRRKPNCPGNFDYDRILNEIHSIPGVGSGTQAPTPSNTLTVNDMANIDPTDVARQQYEILLGRDPNPQELTWRAQNIRNVGVWANAMDIVSSQEYKDRQNRLNDYSNIQQALQVCHDDLNNKQNSINDLTGKLNQAQASVDAEFQANQSMAKQLQDQLNFNKTQEDEINDLKKQLEAKKIDTQTAPVSTQTPVITQKDVDNWLQKIINSLFKRK